jgi:hypothetical protein
MTELVNAKTRNAVLPQVVAAWAKVIYAVEQGGKTNEL